MRLLHRPALLLVACCAAVAVPTTAVAASPEEAFGPQAGQLLRSYVLRGESSPRAWIALGAAGTEYDGLRGIVASSGAVDSAGDLVDVIEQFDLEGSVGDGLVGGGVEIRSTGTFWWQVTNGDAPTAPVEFEVVDRAPVAPPVLTAGRQVLSPAGFRGLRVGMTLRQARRASHLPLKRDAYSLGGCSTAGAKGAGIGVMFLRGKLVRVSTYGKPGQVEGLGGIRVGDPVSKVQATFGRSVTTSGHAYVPGGFYWDVVYDTAPFKHRAIRYVGDRAGVVEDIIVGLPGPVSYVEGCA